MSAGNGVIRIGRKGIKRFAIGEEGAPGGEPFEVDVVGAFHKYLEIDDSFRPEQEDERGNRPIPHDQVGAYHAALVGFVRELGGEPLKEARISKAEALDLIARLREQYDELADFFRARSRDEPDSPGTSAVELRFSQEPGPAEGPAQPPVEAQVS